MKPILIFAFYRKESAKTKTSDFSNTYTKKRRNIIHDSKVLQRNKNGIVT